MKATHRPLPKAEVKVKCVNCGAEKWIGPGDEPVCDKDYGPMYAIAARSTR